MSNIPRVYRSTDPGAPVLSGEPGAFAALMDAVLVDGYGEGVDAKPGLGWIRAYSEVNKRSFRNDPQVYSGHYIRFDDTAAQYVLVDGYEHMSSVDAGIERFEPVSTAWAKSNAASSAARGWIVIGTAKCCYVFIELSGTGAPYGFWFGDFNALGPNDIWSFAYLKTGVTTYSPSTGLFRGSGSQAHGFCVSRSSAGVHTGAARLWHRASLFSSAQYYGASGYAYPLETTQGALLSRAILSEGTSSGSSVPPRGVMPGLWVPEHNATSIYTHGVEYSDFAGMPPGTVLIAVEARNSSSPSVTLCLLDLTLEW